MAELVMMAVLPRFRPPPRRARFAVTDAAADAACKGRLAVPDGHVREREPSGQAHHLDDSVYGVVGSGGVGLDDGRRGAGPGDADVSSDVQVAAGIRVFVPWQGQG